MPGGRCAAHPTRTPSGSRRALAAPSPFRSASAAVVARLLFLPSRPLRRAPARAQTGGGGLPPAAPSSARPLCCLPCLDAHAPRLSACGAYPRRRPPAWVDAGGLDARGWRGWGGGLSRPPAPSGAGPAKVKGEGRTGRPRPALSTCDCGRSGRGEAWVPLLPPLSRASGGPYTLLLPSLHPGPGQGQ